MSRYFDFGRIAYQLLVHFRWVFGAKRESVVLPYFQRDGG